MPTFTIAKERYLNSKYIYHVKQNSSLADPVMCCYGQEAKYCYYKVKSLRNPLRTEVWLTFGVPPGEVIVQLHNYCFCDVKRCKVGL